MHGHGRETEARNMRAEKLTASQHRHVCVCHCHSLHHRLALQSTHFPPHHDARSHIHAPPQSILFYGTTEADGGLDKQRPRNGLRRRPQGRWRSCWRGLRSRPYIRCTYNIVGEAESIANVACRVSSSSADSKPSSTCARAAVAR